MTTRDTINSQFEKVEAELKATFATIETKYSYKCSFGKGRYEPGLGHLSITLECFKDGVLSVDAQRYTANYVRLGLPPLDTHLVYGNKTYRITGINTTGTKVKGSIGDKTWLLPVPMVQMAWKVQKGGL